MARVKNPEVVVHTRHPTPPPHPAPVPRLFAAAYVEHLLEQLEAAKREAVEAQEQRDALVFLLGKLERERQRLKKERAALRALRRGLNSR